MTRCKRYKKVRNDALLDKQVWSPHKVGHSNYTPKKQFDLGSYLKIHIDIVKNIYNKHFYANPPYWYCELNAGPGKVNGTQGSPLIFLERIERAAVPYNALFIERNKECYESLAMLESDSVTVINGDHKEVMRDSTRWPCKSSYGALYHDPNGMASFELLQDLSKRRGFRYVDFFLNLQAATYKRTKGLPERYNARRTSLKEQLDEIDKGYWLIRGPVGRSQWIFLIGSNWLYFPQYTKLGFYRLDSDEGQIALLRAEHTRQELKTCEEYVELMRGRLDCL